MRFPKEKMRRGWAVVSWGKFHLGPQQSSRSGNENITRVNAMETEGEHFKGEEKVIASNAIN